MVGDQASDYTKDVMAAQREVSSERSVIMLTHTLKEGEVVQMYSRTNHYIHGPCELTTSVWLDGSIEQSVAEVSQTS